MRRKKIIRLKNKIAGTCRKTVTSARCFFNFYCLFLGQDVFPQPEQDVFPLFFSLTILTITSIIQAMTAMATSMVDIFMEIQSIIGHSPFYRLDFF